MTVKIVTDSCSDITQEEAKKLGIIVVPAYLAFGNQVYRDEVDIGREEFYQKLMTSSVHPTTAAPSPGDFAKVYEEVAKEAEGIASIHVTRRHSALYEAALVGKDMARTSGCPIEVIDSKGVTVWQGLAVLAAAKAAQAGSSLEQVVNKVHQAISQLRALALLDTIMYAVKGGRLGKAASAIAVVESLLHVKSFITLHEGEIRPAGLVRTRSKGIERLKAFTKMAAHIEDLAIAYSTTPDDAQKLADHAISLFPGIVPWVARLGPVLGVHGGPGTLVVVAREARQTRSAT